MSASLVVVIPTRNRGDLAVEAARSLLRESDRRLVRVIISDNSSSAADIARVAGFVDTAADERLLLVRPPQPLPMADHWNWATGEALARTDATHVALHYDRRLSRAGLSSQLLDVAERWPRLAITYLLDFVYPTDAHFRLQQTPGSGASYEIRTARATELAARGMLTERWLSFPVLVNSVTPRSVLEKVQHRFGSFCASTSPESCFGFRYCAVEESYLHYDRAFGVHYALHRSNGMGYVRGETGGTFGDFLQLFGDRPWLDAAPMPGLSLGQNTFYNEYEIVRREAPEAHFPPIEMEGYLRDIARGLPFIADADRRAETAALLREHGWNDAPSAIPDVPLPRRVARRMKNALLAPAARWLGIRRRDAAFLDFATEAEALTAASRFASPPSNHGLLSALDPVLLP